MVTFKCQCGWINSEFDRLEHQERAWEWHGAAPWHWVHSPGQIFSRVQVPFFLYFTPSSLQILTVWVAKLLQSKWPQRQFKVELRLLGLPNRKNKKTTNKPGTHSTYMDGFWALRMMSIGLFWLKSVAKYLFRFCCLFQIWHQWIYLGNVARTTNPY